jgi:hypothetical protein
VHHSIHCPANLSRPVHLSQSVDEHEGCSFCRLQGFDRILHTVDPLLSLPYILFPGGFSQWRIGQVLSHEHFQRMQEFVLHQHSAEGSCCMLLLKSSIKEILRVLSFTSCMHLQPGLGTVKNPALLPTVKHLLPLKERWASSAVEQF